MSSCYSRQLEINWGGFHRTEPDIRLSLIKFFNASPLPPGRPTNGVGGGEMAPGQVLSLSACAAEAK